ncbi:MAG: PHP domain-containing protein [Candidatus Gracilibacteria bacterium]|nr:PHP domain-containing protein [Candidatus Gracilibacteria bacterium]MDD2909189.1 PHP domain-containing protein [Candidatus Gracilibacteria bacterium]
MKQFPKNIGNFMNSNDIVDRNKYNIVSLHDGHPEDTDGKISIEEYLSSRINAGLDIIAISDHNTLATNKKTIKYTEQDEKSEFYNKLKIIPSIELSLGGKFPGHLIFLDFDLKEFQKCFYEEYLFEYLSKYFENRGKITDELMGKINKGELNNFQPSQIQSNTDTALIFEAIIAMKKDPTYKYIIFPGDTPEEVFEKLLFHFEKGNITKFPIIQIPHPTLGRKVSITKPIAHTLSKHIKSLENLGLTTYGGLVQSEESREYLLSELNNLKEALEERGADLNILYEVHNDKDIVDEGSSMDNFDSFGKLGAIPCIGFDGHEEKTPTLGIALPKGNNLRQYLNSDEFRKNSNHLYLVSLREGLTVKKLSQKIKELVSDLIFIQRWNIDPICNEFINLDPENQNPLNVYHTINSLDSEMVGDENLSKSVERKDIGSYKKIQKRWKSAKMLQKLFIKSKDIKTSSEQREAINSIHKLEYSTLRIISDKSWKEINKNGIKALVNPDGTVFEYIEGKFKGEQLFTQRAAIIEAKKQGKKLPSQEQWGQIIQSINPTIYPSTYAYNDSFVRKELQIKLVGIHMPYNTMQPFEDYFSGIGKEAFFWTSDDGISVKVYSSIIFPMSFTDPNFATSVYCIEK